MVSSKTKKAEKTKPSIAFVLSMVLVASLFVVAFSGSVSAKASTYCGKYGGSFNCCTGDAGPGGGFDCHVCDSFGGSCSSYEGVARDNCQGCRAFEMGVIQREIRNSVLNDGCATFPKVETGASDSEIMSLRRGDQESGMEVVDIRGGEATVRIEGRGEISVGEGDLLKAGPQSSQPFQVESVKGGFLGGKEAEFEKLQGRCDGELKKIEKGETLEFTSANPDQGSANEYSFTFTNLVEDREGDSAAVFESGNDESVPLKKEDEVGVSGKSAPATIMKVDEGGVIVCICEGNHSVSITGGESRSRANAESSGRRESVFSGLFTAN